MQPQRMKDALAFLKVHVGGSARSLSWLWVDSLGMTVNQSYIEFFEGQTIESFYKDAIMRYDRAELPRLCQWNSRQAVHIVQRRIYHWTKNGYPSMVSGEDELRAMFEEVVLCSDTIPISKNGYLQARFNELSAFSFISYKVLPNLVSFILIRGNIGAQVVGRIKVKLSYIDY